MPEFISLYDFMARANAQYYAARDAIGANGDFITAPEISQMFGELLGAWVIARWNQMGRPAPFYLIELGPGKGTLMADMLRVLRAHADVYEAVQIQLVETSPKLRRAQKEKLREHQIQIHWHDELKTVPHAPFILVANEFLDALPIRQFIYTLEGWQERGVELIDGEYVWATRAADNPPHVPPYLPAPIPGNMLETCPDMDLVLGEIAQRLKQYAGSALLIDYGYGVQDYGDTFQAVSGHEYADTLENPGEQDLTAHVNFAAIENFGQKENLQVAGPTGQGEFLMRLGLQHRADKLIENTASPADKLEVIEAAYRLTSPDEMGSLFKVICLSSPHLPPPEGFHAP
jgi:NADH dehydrogenase [ubiquinone] 1 alpha subcomplex assembly factor 7